MSGDPAIINVIKTGKAACRNNNPRNCLKPINVPGSKIKALEINVSSTSSVSFSTYDGFGAPTDLEPSFNLKVLAQREPAIIDANVELREDLSEGTLDSLCNLKNGLACYQLGNKLLSQNETKKSLRYYNAGCELGISESCSKIAEYFFREKKSSEAIKVLKKSCEASEGKTCLKLGIAYMDDKKVNEALDVFMKSCKTTLEGCFLLGEVFAKENPIESLNSYMKGCAFPNGGSLCYLAASILARSEKPESREKAIEYFNLSCAKKYLPGCSKTPTQDLSTLKAAIFKTFAL